MAGVTFVAHCLLKQNAKVGGGALTAGALAAELAERGFPLPRAMGVSRELPDHDPTAERAALAELLGA